MIAFPRAHLVTEESLRTSNMILVNRKIGWFFMSRRTRPIFFKDIFVLFFVAQYLKVNFSAKILIKWWINHLSKSHPLHWTREFSAPRISHSIQNWHVKAWKMGFFYSRKIDRFSYQIPRDIFIYLFRYHALYLSSPTAKRQKIENSTTYKFQVWNVL